MSVKRVLCLSSMRDIFEEFLSRWEESCAAVDPHDCDFAVDAVKRMPIEVLRDKVSVFEGCLATGPHKLEAAHAYVEHMVRILDPWLKELQGRKLIRLQAVVRSFLLRRVRAKRAAMRVQSIWRGLRVRQQLRTATEMRANLIIKASIRSFLAAAPWSVSCE